MAILPDLLKELQGGEHHPAHDDAMVRSPVETGTGQGDDNVMAPSTMQKQMMGGQAQPGDITGDNGIMSTDQSNPFLNALKNIASDPKNRGSLLGSVYNLLNPTPMKNTPANTPLPTVGGQDPSKVPGEGTDAALDPTPLADQPQSNMTPSAPGGGTQGQNVPLPKPRPSQYAQPTALDPVGIEQLRQSLLTQAGQMDPNNPNGLSGRMASPLAESDMGQQRNQAMSIEDSLRGFDGEKSAKIATASKGRKL